MSKFGNKKKDKFLSTLSALSSLEDMDNDLTTRCKFDETVKSQKQLN